MTKYINLGDGLYEVWTQDKGSQAGLVAKVGNRWQAIPMLSIEPFDPAEAHDTRHAAAAALFERVGRANKAAKESDKRGLQFEATRLTVKKQIAEAFDLPVESVDPTHNWHRPNPKGRRARQKARRALA